MKIPKNSFGMKASKFPVQEKLQSTTKNKFGLLNKIWTFSRSCRSGPSKKGGGGGITGFQGWTHATIVATICNRVEADHFVRDGPMFSVFSLWKKSWYVVACRNVIKQWSHGRKPSSDGFVCKILLTPC